jgi:hypothetical protein
MLMLMLARIVICSLVFIGAFLQNSDAPGGGTGMPAVATSSIGG